MPHLPSYIQTIQQAYPDLAITTTALIEHGQNNIVLRVNDAFIFRFPKYPAGISSLARETALLHQLRGALPLPIPDPTYIHLDGQSVGTAFVGYPIIPGKPLWSNLFTTLDDPATLDTLARQLGSFLQALHHVPITDALVPLLPRVDTAAEWRDIFERIRAQLVPRMRPEAQTRTIQQFEAFLSDPGQFAYTPALKHGDFGASNILFDATTRSIQGIIDFSGAGFGDPAYDFAGLVSSYGAAFVQRLERWYPGLEALWSRIMFYRGTFALLEALFGVEHGDPDAFARGMDDYV